MIRQSLCYVSSLALLSLYRCRTFTTGVLLRSNPIDHRAFVTTYRPPNSPRFAKLWLPAAAAALLVVGVLLGLSLGSEELTLLRLGVKDEVSANAHGVGTVEEILRYIEAKYVDEVDREQLIEATIDNVLAELDPHSSYISSERLAGHRAQLEGSSTGIGVDVLMIRDSVTVVSALPGGPAAEAGLVPYDRIISIADSTVSGRGLSSADVDRWLTSLPDERIELRVFRPGSGELLPVRLLRRKVTIPSVSEGEVLDGDTGYVRIRQFGSETYEEFMAQLEDLVTKRQIEHLILDLRGNSGGYLNEAVQLLSQLFPQEGQLLVYTEGAHSPRKEYKSTGRVFFPVNHVAVIIDRGSASASEIVAGAVKDWDRGTIVGQRSFGKGLVQELYPLNDGGALHITVSRYFTPSGRSIQRDYERFGAFTASLGDSLATSPGNAFATASGRRVYGGGGIAPDIEVTSNSTLDDDGFVHVRPYLETFVFERAEQEPRAEVNERLLQQLRHDLHELGYTFSDADWSYYRPALMSELSFRLSHSSQADHVGESPEVAQLRQDPFVQAALQAIRNPQARLLN